MNAGRVAEPLLLSIDDPSAVARVAAALRSGLVAAIPTDTVYGLAAAIDRPDAIDRLYSLKSRPYEKAIPVLLADVAALDQVAENVPQTARMLIEHFWPGALTVVVPALPGLAARLTAVADDGTRTVAVRIPDLPVAREILAAAGGALAVTSANRSGEPPALTALAVMDLGDAAPDVIVDGGPAPLCEPSTIVLAVAGDISVLREGAIPAVAIAAALRDAGKRIRESEPANPHAV